MIDQWHLLLMKILATVYSNDSCSSMIYIKYGFVQKSQDPIILADFTSGQPKLSVDQENPYLDDIVTFSCDKVLVDGNPAVSQVRWLKNDRRLSGWSNATFTISRMVTTEDSGVYTCIVSNAVSSSELSNTVLVNVSSIVSKYHCFQHFKTIPVFLQIRK